MKTPKIAKGTEVVVIHPWNLGRGEATTFTMSTRSLTIESLGKKQGTAVANEGGKFIQTRVYPGEIGVSIFAAAEMNEASILEVAKKYQDEQIAYYESKIGNEHFYQPSILQGLAESRKPLLVKGYEELARAL